MNYSVFGEKLGTRAMIVNMMDDLNKSLAESNTIMLGGGNPSRIDAVENIIENVISKEFNTNGFLFDLISNYSSPKGNQATAEIVTEYLKEECKWDVNKDNIFFCNGSQSALFMLFNMFGGRNRSGGHNNILLPFTPEYIGYEDLFIDGYYFVGNRPLIKKTGSQSFKYHVDLKQLADCQDISCVAISSPSNPSGKCFDHDELNYILDYCNTNSLPLIYDNAYGWPFPNIQFIESTFKWDRNMIVTMSLSKMGLPGLRTGIVIANEDTIERMRCINAVSQLAPNNFGMYVIEKLIKSRLMSDITNEIITPFYKKRSKLITNTLKDKLNGYPVRIHEAEGTIFLWLWLDGLGIKSQLLYEKIKQKGVLTLSGHHFFIGNKESEWSHKDECLRITFTQPMELIENGIDIVSNEIKKIYDSNKNI